MNQRSVTDRRAYVVDDDAALRATIRRILTPAGVYTEEFSSAEAFLQGYSGRPVGCVLLDVRLPGMSGLDLLTTIRSQPPANAFIILSGYADIPMTVTAVKAGAVEVLEKPFRNQRLIEAVAQALDKVGSHQSRSPSVPLTPREREVLVASSDGAPAKVVAFRLDLSPRTLEAHRATIVKKLGVRNMTQALLTAKESGYIS